MIRSGLVSLPRSCPVNHTWSGVVCLPTPSCRHSRQGCFLFEDPAGSHSGPGHRFSLLGASRKMASPGDGVLVGRKNVDPIQRTACKLYPARRRCFFAAVRQEQPNKPGSPFSRSHLMHYHRGSATGVPPDVLTCRFSCRSARWLRTSERGACGNGGPRRGVIS